jgi:phospholipid-transporting ATPase
VWSDDPKPSVQSFLVFFSYFLLYNTMIPISLIVSMEFVKVFQSYFIEKDIDMYVAQRDKFAKANTSTINEELGQVEYIFSDKTGTLTCNQMEFKYCIIGNVLYGRGNESSKDKK